MICLIRSAHTRELVPATSPCNKSRGQVPSGKLAMFALKSSCRDQLSLSLPDPARLSFRAAFRSSPLTESMESNRLSRRRWSKDFLGIQERVRVSSDHSNFRGKWIAFIFSTQVKQHMQWTKMAFILIDSLFWFFEEIFFVDTPKTSQTGNWNPKNWGLRYACSNFAHSMKQPNSFRITT